MEPLQVIVRIKGQQIYFEGKSYPSYLIAWKKGADFFPWNGCPMKREDIEDWWVIHGIPVGGSKI